MTGRYVYFARAGHMVKIGCSEMPKSRLGAFGEWIPYKITMMGTMPGSFDLEAALHAHFYESWSHGEWFYLNDDVAQDIEKLLAGDPIALRGCPGGIGSEMAKRLKIAASFRVVRAEKKAGLRGWRKPDPVRPDYLLDAITSWQGSSNPPPTPEALAAVERYERELAERAA